MNMNCCSNESKATLAYVNDCGSSEILTKEVDLSSKESVLKRHKELEQVQRNLYDKMENLGKKYTELFKTELINRNIKGKCFVSDKNINSCYGPINDVKPKYVEYFRVTEIKYVYYNSITLVCDFFNKYEDENSKKAYHFGHGVIEVLHSALDEKNEITLQEFKQKREEYFNEYKEYVQ